MAQKPHISLRNETDVLEVLPALLGFYPTSHCAPSSSPEAASR